MLFTAALTTPAARAIPRGERLLRPPPGSPRRTVQRAVGAAATAASGVGKAAGLDLSAPNRRAVLTQGIQLLAAVAAGAPPQAVAGVDLESLILGAPASGPPRAYIKLMNDLVPALRESVELDRSGASELKVRAKAGEVKENIQRFLKEWKDKPEVVNELSYVAVQDALRTLGNFYAKNGQRVPLSDEVITVVLKDLAAAEESLELF